MPPRFSVDNRYISPATWYGKDGKTFQPQVHYNVGGATKLYGAALYRLREKDFRSPPPRRNLPGLAAVRCGFRAVYMQAEQLYQVHGIRGEDPTEPPSSAPYLFPPVSNEPRIEQLYDDLKEIGMTPFHAPAGILLNEAEPAFSVCIRCATCDGFPCLVHAKSDAEVIAVRPAIAHQDVTLLRNALVQKLEPDASGRTVVTVLAVVDGAEQRFTADIVVVSAGAANSAKLLLGSANDQHPSGLANGSEQVGRNYVFHNSRAFLAISLEKNTTRFRKTLGVDDVYSATTSSARWSARARRRYTEGTNPWKRHWHRRSRSATSPSMPSISGSPPRICRVRRTGSPWRRTATWCSPTRRTPASRWPSCTPGSNAT
jgi:choline dehydrogenase-like flavoprotein